MLTAADINRLFEKVNAALALRGEAGEIGLVGGAVMCLVYNARAATKDVDAVFEPSAIMREIAAQIANEEGLPEDWLNDAAKSFLRPGFSRQEVLCLSNLNVWAPEPRYMLAMKSISARWDTNDRDDLEFLLQLLKINKEQEVFSIIENFYPDALIPAKTKFLIEELLGRRL